MLYRALLKFQLTRNSLDDQRPVVKGSDSLFETTKSFGDIDVHLHDKVSAIAFESSMLLFVKDDNDITWLKSGLLITFAAESNFLTIAHTFVDGDFQNLPFAIDFLAVTFLAT